MTLHGDDDQTITSLDSQSYGTTNGNDHNGPVASSAALPRLPPELLLQILLSPNLSPILSPSPLTHTTLQALLLVSRLTHACAQEHLQSVLLLPRHVRDFRKWYDRQRNAGFPGVGTTHAAFCALDDVSRLTHTSAGWESCFLRMLHILGPGINHLSLWHSESRILLRDAGQVRGRHRRLGALGPAWAWGEGDDFEDVRGSDDEEDHGSEEEEDGTGSKAVINSAAELAAMRERARQKMPQWLRRELETKPVAEVARTHRAHLAPYGDVDAAVAAAATGTSDDLLTQHAVNSRKDKRQLKGCRPTSLSIILSLPLFENQEPALFASMLVFSRCKYLDCHFPVPAHAPKLLWLVSHLVRSPLERLKLSSTHATLVLGLPPFNSQQAEAMRRRDAVNARQVGSRRGAPQQQPVNLALGLRAILEDENLRCLLHWEFAGKHADAPRQLERALTEVVVERGRRRGGSTAASAPARSEVTDDGLDSVYGAPRDPCEDIEAVRVRLFQRNQGGYGKMKDRRDDFVQQSMGLSQGIWEKCGLWGEGDQVVESEKEWR